MSPFSKPILRYFLLWMLIGSGLFLLLTMLVAGNSQLSEAIGMLLFQSLALLPLGWLLWWHHTKRINLYWFFRSVNPGFSLGRLFLIWISLLLLSFGLEGLTNLLLARVVPRFIEDLLSDQIFDRELPLIFNLLTFILAVVIAPVMEEFVFRGLLLQRMVVKYGATAGILWSSFFFGILHFESWPSASIFGLVMSLIYLRSGNLWVPIILHIANNMVAVIISVYQQQIYGQMTLAVLKDQQVLFIGALLALPGLIFLTKNAWPEAKALIPYHHNFDQAS